EKDQITCYIGYTNHAIHQAIRNNLHESPLYSGKIKGIGPRYCPSIEDKVVKFADKNRHQLFLEPEGHNTHEVYLNGFSTSLPAGLQQELVNMIPGLEEACIIRPGYAIKYDYIDPRELNPYLETAKLKGLFHAGQSNGTTGYEEAGCQGLLAGINASLSVSGRDGFRLGREESYIGVLIDDLITQGVDEPYRMFTSRAESRLTLRFDTADARLCPHGRELGLVGDSYWDAFTRRRAGLAQLRAALETTRFKRNESKYRELCQIIGTDLGNSITLAQLSQRPNVNISLIHLYLPPEVRSTLRSDLETVLADILYAGYIDLQRQSSQRSNHFDGLCIPNEYNYRTISGLSHEMIERLERVRPQTFGQARRIPGLTPAAISTLLVSLQLRKAA